MLLSSVWSRIHEYIRRALSNTRHHRLDRRPVGRYPQSHLPSKRGTNDRGSQSWSARSATGGAQKHGHRILGKTEMALQHRANGQQFAS